jgi:hypothetical protein
MILFQMQSPSGENSQEISHILLSPKFYNRVYTSPPTVPTLRDTPCPQPATLPSGLFPSDFLTKTLLYVSVLFHACHTSRPSHLPWFVQPNNIWSITQATKFRYVIFCSLPVTSPSQDRNLEHTKPMFSP